MIRFSMTFAIIMATVPLASQAQLDGAASVSFKQHRIGTYRGESCGIADFNNDGKQDIVALPYLYLAPEYTAVKICEIEGEVGEDGRGYRWDFMNAPLDVDGDGLLDIVTCSWFGKKSEWLKNSGVDGTQWPRTLIHENGPFECGDLWDIDGDGKALEVLPDIQATVWYESGILPDGTRGMLQHMVTEEELEFGSGCGDVNGDGRPDILRPNAWFEAPQDPRKGEWTKHPIALGGKEDGTFAHTPQILVYDINDDGLNDILTSIAHDYGIFWYEQKMTDGERSWTRHLIDESWSQAHSLTLADMDLDGDLDLVTGKRFFAHDGHDPGAMEPLGVYWYELDRGADAKWTKHVISFDEKIGSGLTLPVKDIDGDGDMDLVVTGKWGGPVLFENLLK